MEWNEKLKEIIDYVEDHLQRREEPIDENVVAEIAGCSFGFFQKVFSYMNGISFSEYIRSRKLTLAGYDLKSTDLKVVDISYKYGYASPTSFTKAFQQFHGVTPKEARDKETELKIAPKMQMSNRQQYSWHIEQREAFRLVGKSRTFSCRNGEHYALIPAFWNECQRAGDLAALSSLDRGKNKGIFGLFTHFDEQLNETTYSIMVECDQEAPPGFEETAIRKASWAVFDCRGSIPQSIHNGWNYLNEEWLIKYPFKHAPCPELEWYSDGDQTSDTYKAQIWIPIIEER